MLQSICSIDSIPAIMGIQAKGRIAHGCRLVPGHGDIGSCGKTQTQWNTAAKVLDSHWRLQKSKTV